MQLTYLVSAECCAVIPCLTNDLGDDILPAIRSACYNEFKVAHGDNWRELLETYSELKSLGVGSGETVASRARHFNKLHTKASHLVSLFFTSRLSSQRLNGASAVQSL